MKPIIFLGDSLDRIRDFPVDARHDTGAFRVVYYARRPEAVYPACLPQKTQATAKRDIDLAAKRYNQLMRQSK